MNPPAEADRAARAAAGLGFLGLVAAMGIGRFAFTPQLPLMLAEGALSLPQGGWLAAANYAGYLIGALWALAQGPRPELAMRRGLIAVALTTLGMAFVHDLPWWLLLRGAAGVASAFVLVGVSGWALAALALAGRAQWAGVVYAGVGAGICGAGLLVQVLGAWGLPSTQGWIWLGAIAAAVASLVGLQVRPVAAGAPAQAAAAQSAASGQAAASGLGLVWAHRGLVLAYGALGFGYIIPATYLPAVARERIADPAVFGWVWPVFGLAAALSTVLAARLFASVEPRRVWGWAQGLMAAGVVLPALSTAMPALVLSALAVGGSFMVITMAGMQQARRVGGSAGPRLMAALTASFAAGQLLGPLVLPAARDAAQAIRVPSLVAAALLLLTSVWLLRPSGPRSIP